MIEQSKLEAASNTIIYWLYIAKHNLYLKSLVSRVNASNLQKQCFQCKSSNQKDLKLIPKINFYSLINKYRILTSGEGFDKNDWIRFYEKE